MLFVASTGGHLAQLVRLSGRFDPSDESVWITFDTEQSRSLLRGKRVVFVPYIRSRDLLGVLRGALDTRRLLRSEKFAGAVSTGAGLALSVLPQAKLMGIPTTYVESVSRLDGPSLSGRIIALTRTANLYTQHKKWSTNRWKPVESVLSSFECSETRSPAGSLKLFITLGTIQKYRFDRLIDAVLAAGIADEQTVWQVGETSRADLPGVVHKQMSAHDFTRSAKEADVVITHAGVGTILQLLEMGKFPIVVARAKSHNEHVDDHQFQIAKKIASMSVGDVMEPHDISDARIRRASKFSVRASSGPKLIHQGKNE